MPRNDIEDELNRVNQALQRLAQITLPATGGEALTEARRHLQTLTEALEERGKSLRLELLYNVSQSLGASLELEEVLDRVVEAVIELTAAERCYLLLLDADSQQLEMGAAHGQDGESQPAYSRTVIRTAVEQGTGLLTTDAQVDPRFADQESVVIHALRSILCTPLRWRGQMIGVLYADNPVQSGVFKETDLELLEALAVQAAIAIENARLYTQTDRRLRERVAELETLAQIDRQLNATLDLAQVAGITLDWAVDGTQAESGWIALGEPGSAELTIIAGERSGIQVQTTEALIEDAWHKSQPVRFATQSETPARLVAPILRAGVPVGVLLVERAVEFSDADLQFLSRLAGHASIALDNARLHQAVQQANLAKTKFVSVVVHELRIPMTAIKGYADLLRQGAVGSVNEAQLNFLDVIRNNVGRMAALVSDLSDLNRVESGRMKLELGMFSVYEVVQDAVKSLGPNIAQKNQTLQVEVADGLPEVYADPQRVSQIFTNLLNNAWKYTPEQGSIRVKAWLSQPDGLVEQMLRIEVVDTGIGISEEDQQQLFTPFFRSEALAVREEQGWGLGLSVARSLVELMGGEIGVVSELEKGSNFWFTLPLQPEEQEIDTPS
jgi:signal transduction histidine kinase